MDTIEGPTEPKGAKLNNKYTLYTLPRWDTNHWWDKTSGKPIFPLNLVS